MAPTRETKNQTKIVSMLKPRYIAEKRDATDHTCEANFKVPNPRHAVQPQAVEYLHTRIPATTTANEGGGQRPPAIERRPHHHSQHQQLPQFAQPQLCPATTTTTSPRSRVRAHPLLPLGATPSLGHRRRSAASVLFNLSERTERAVPFHYQAGPKTTRVSAGATVCTVVSVCHAPSVSTPSRCCCCCRHRRQ